MELLVAREAQKTKRVARAGRPEPNADGVDVTLIRWMLSLSPLERLRAVQSSARSLVRLRAGRTKP